MRILKIADMTYAFILILLVDLTLSFSIQQTWSNRNGLILTPINRNIYGAERPFIWNNIDVGGRSAIIKTLNGGIFVHSPIEWTEELAKELQSLGDQNKCEPYSQP
jgi:hypothetical protein